MVQDHSLRVDVAFVGMVACPHPFTEAYLRLWKGARPFPTGWRCFRRVAGLSPSVPGRLSSLDGMVQDHSLRIYVAFVGLQACPHPFTEAYLRLWKGARPFPTGWRCFRRDGGLCQDHNFLHFVRGDCLHFVWGECLHFVWGDCLHYSFQIPQPAIVDSYGNLIHLL